jgi:hypothetical protein
VPYQPATDVLITDYFVPLDCPVSSRRRRLESCARRVLWQFLLLQLFWIYPLRIVADPILTIEVLRGANGNNNALAGTSVSPAICVKDASGNPVPGALVVFSAPSSGASLNFAGAGPVAHVLTDETGTAIAPHSVPAGDNGPVEIRVLATRDGASANLSIFQMNLGLNQTSLSGSDLELSGFTEVVTVGTRTTKVRRFQVIVGGMAGNVVAGASVEFSVREAKDRGKWEPLNPLQELSDSDGRAAAAMRPKSGHAPLEFSVKATFDGQTATRYFMLEH